MTLLKLRTQEKSLTKPTYRKELIKMLSNLLLFASIVVAIVIVGLVLAILFSVYGMIHLKIKQLSLRIEHDPMANPIRNEAV